MQNAQRPTPNAHILQTNVPRSTLNTQRLTLNAQRLFRLALLTMLSVAWQPRVGSQGVATPMLKAAANDELPLPAWGPYSVDHIGPTCLVNRLLLQQFAFPIVVSQQQDETQIQSERSADGRLRVRSTPVVLRRRTLVLAPVHGADDDRSLPGMTVTTNRLACPLDVDRDGLLWRIRATFAPAGLAQNVAQTPDQNTATAETTRWGAGEVSVDYFPAFAAPAGDGLIVRVALTNLSDRPQTYAVDLLGGQDTSTPMFRRDDLTLDAAADDTTLVLKHPNCAAVFALGANALPYPVRRYRINDAYFSASGATERRDSRHDPIPEGAQRLDPDPPQAAGTRAARNRKGKRATGLAEAPEPPTAAPQATTFNLSAPWGLIRVADIAVQPAESVTLFLSIGVGADADTARESARTLLNIAQDIPIGTQARAGARPRRNTRNRKSSEGRSDDEPQPETAPHADANRDGAYTMALRAHEDDRWPGTDPSLARLIAQTLFNAPLQAARRRGIASRVSTHGREPGRYNPSDGAMITLALAAIDPSDAAAEINIHYWTQAPEPPADAPRTLTPINLLALWELYQTTHDTSLLAHFFPAAQRDYQAQLAAGRLADGAWKFAWPAHPQDPIFAPTGTRPGTPAPDYAAYVIRAAILLRNMARLIHRPDDEIQRLSDDILHVAGALNTTPPSAVDSPDLFSLVPLIAGSEALPAERRAELLAALTDPDRYWSGAGLRQLSRTAAGYRSSDPHAGAVRFGTNWLLWKALLDLGETTTARRLADALLDGYRRATKAGGCPEWLDGDTGAPGGALDVSGDACGLIPLYAAYHLAGTVTTGWNVVVLDQRYDHAADTLHIAFRNLEPQHGSVLVCALNRPNGVYRLSGALQGTQTADADGVLTLTAPQDPTTQSLDIVPNSPPTTGTNGIGTNHAGTSGPDR